ncbi:hypothetical protein BN2537_15447 [Streptomyces venezuelae]|nr:hypothetical protein BN2537_15447 [Streptomyces venezuelae]
MPSTAQRANRPWTGPGGAEPLGQVPPGQPGAELAHDALENLSVILPPATSPTGGRQ